MYLVSVEFTKPENEVQAVMNAHREYLQEYYAQDKILGWVSKIEPDNGGFVLYDCATREEAQALIALDPFAIEGVAKHTLYTIKPNQMKEDIYSRLFE